MCRSAFPSWVVVVQVILGNFYWCVLFYLVKLFAATRILVISCTSLISFQPFAVYFPSFYLFKSDCDSLDIRCQLALTCLCAHSINATALLKWKPSQEIHDTYVVLKQGGSQTVLDSNNYNVNSRAKWERTREPDVWYFCSKPRK